MKKKSIAATTYKLVDSKKRTPEQEEKIQRYKHLILEQMYAWAPSLEEAKKLDTTKSIFFPGADGIYVLSKFKINGNIIESINKADSCPLLPKIDSDITNYSITNKIPGNLVKEILGSFNLICKKTGDEAAAQIYRSKSGEYFIYYPEQTVSKASVSYPNDPKVQDLRVDNELVCELHSHNTMSAFWSGTDDNNEKEVGFYVVFGNLNLESATYKARVKYQSVYKDLHLYDLFDITEEEETALLKLTNREDGNPEIEKKVKRNTYSTVASSYRGCFDYIPSFYTYYADDPNDYTDDPMGYKDPGSKKPSENNSVTINSKGDGLSSFDELIQDYVADAASDYCRGNISVSTMGEYLEGVVGVSIKDMDPYVKDRYDDGHKLNKLAYSPKEADRFANAFNDIVNTKIVQEYILEITYGTLAEDPDDLQLYTPDGVYKLIKNINNSHLISSTYDTRFVWETMSLWEKFIVAQSFDTDVISFGSFMYDVEICSFLFLKLLYSIITCGYMKRQYYKDFINSVDSYYKELMEELNEEGSTDEDGEASYKVLDYLNAIIASTSDDDFTDLDDVVSSLFTNENEEPTINEVTDEYNEFQKAISEEIDYYEKKEKSTVAAKRTPVEQQGVLFK